MKIGILGVGGVGSLVASRLCLSDNEIFCFGSEKSNLFIKSNGILMESSFYGNTKVFPNNNINLKDKLDILFITVKGTYLISALKKYRNHFNENTVAISLLNGLGHKELIRKEFNIKLIVASIGSLEVSLNSKRIAIHKTKIKPFVEMYSNDKNLYKTMIFLKNLLNSISIHTEILEDENNVIWRKLRRLCVISTITSMQNTTIGHVRDDKDLRKIMIKLINEICSITIKAGIKTNQRDLFEEIENLPYDLKTSMQKDIYSGKPSEIEYILKAPLIYGNKLGLELPNMNYCYKFLKNIINNSDNKKIYD